MAHVTVIAKVVSDNTGIVAEIPVILTDYGVLMPLVEYVVEIKHLRSTATITKLVQAVGLLLDYMEANQDSYDNPKELFAGFVQRLYTGTVSEDGQDPSGLYWNGRTPSAVRQMVAQLSAVSDWIAKEQDHQPFNPWRQATRAEEMLAWAAWHHKRDRAFLAHTWDRNSASLKMTRARNVLLKKTPIIDHDEAKHFPEDHFPDLIFRGFIVPGKQNSSRIEERLNLRDILITLLMHYGGLRMSEPFHLYAQDIERAPARFLRRDWVGRDPGVVDVTEEVVRGSHGPFEFVLHAVIVPHAEPKREPCRSSRASSIMCPYRNETDPPAHGHANLRRDRGLRRHRGRI